LVLEECMGAKAALKSVLPTSAHNLYRRYEEWRALAAIPRLECDAHRLRTQPPVIADPPDWRAVQERVAFGQSRGQAVNTGDQRLIYHLASSLRPRTVLEIGTNVGGSTVMFSMALGDDGRMTTVDIVDVNGPDGPARRLGCETPAELIRRIGHQNVRFVTSRSTEFLRDCREQFDLIFLDGAHEADVVYQEVPLALACLNPGGVILLHDYFPDLKPLWSNGRVIPGPWLAIERLKREGVPLTVKPFGALPWETKLNSNNTSLALLLRQ
jgi:predicted O-methyltransferase YrrM